MNGENLRSSDLLEKEKQVLKTHENYHQAQLRQQQNTVELLNMVNDNQNQSTNTTNNNKTDFSLKTENSFANKSENTTITKESSQQKNDLNNNQGIKLKNLFKRESSVVRIKSNERANNSYLDEEANKRNEKILTRIKVLFPIGCTVLSVLGTVAVIAVSSYYFGTIGQVAEGNYCLNDKYCNAQSLLICKNNTCKCGSQYTFDKSTNICIFTNATLQKNNTNETTKTTNLLTIEMTSVAKTTTIPMTTTSTTETTTAMCLTNIGSLGSNLTITCFNGTAFSFNWGVATLYADQVYYFTTDYTYSVVVKFNESGEAVKVVSLYFAEYLTVYNKTVYVTSNNGLLSMFDIDLNLLKSISLNMPYAIDYNAFLNRLFVMVMADASMEIFDSNLNTISTMSSIYVYAITSYNEFIYTSDSSSIHERNATNGVILRTLTQPCFGYIYGLVVDGSGQYLYISCYSMQKVIVVNRNFTLTGRFYDTLGSPMQLTFDYYGQLVVAIQFISGIQIISVTP